MMITVDGEYAQMGRKVLGQEKKKSLALTYHVNIHQGGKKRSNERNSSFCGAHSNGERQEGGGEELIVQGSPCPCSRQPVQGRTDN